MNHLSDIVHKPPSEGQIMLGNVFQGNAPGGLIALVMKLLNQFYLLTIPEILPLLPKICRKCIKTAHMASLLATYGNIHFCQKQ